MPTKDAHTIRFLVKIDKLIEKKSRRIYTHIITPLKKKNQLFPLQRTLQQYDLYHCKLLGYRNKTNFLIILNFDKIKYEKNWSI